jgi:CubicO group peptidase (beta-lactamase class C family)
MKTYFLFLSFFLVFYVTYGQNDEAYLQQIDKFLHVEYPQKEPGATVLIAKKGTVIFEKAYGLASIKPKRKLQTDMVFQIGSMSK